MNKEKLEARRAVRRAAQKEQEARVDDWARMVKSFDAYEEKEPGKLRSAPRFEPRFGWNDPTHSLTEWREECKYQSRLAYEYWKKEFDRVGVKHSL